MEFLYSAGRKHCDPRYCRTHADVAQLFAESPSSGFNGAAWSYIAQAWSDLADFKEKIARKDLPERPALDGPISADERLNP